MSERPHVLQMGPDPAIGGGMAAALRGLLASPLGERYALDVVPTYRGSQPVGRLVVYCATLARLVVWSLRRRGRIVHVHGTVRGSMYRKSVCVLVAKALRRRVVFHVHSGAGDIAAFRSRNGRLALSLFRSAFAAADAVLAVSLASAEALQGVYGRADIEIVPNAAPLVPAFDRPEAGVDGLGVAYLGGFANPAKGGDVLFEALALALPLEGGARVTLAGPGELPPAGAELLARHPSVVWKGWLEEDEREALMRSAQVLVIPSRSEGLPMALLEGMAHGIAVVATQAGGMPEIVESGKNGMLVPVDDPQALAVALEQLAGDRQLRGRLGRAARKRVERLDAVEVADRLDALYSGLL